MKKTYATSMPNHIGAFLKASKCFATLSINITRVSYDKSVDSHMLFLDVEGYQHERVTVGGMTADLYTTTEERECNVIIWNSKHSGVMFQISADLEKDELIALAESVQHRKIPVETKP